MKKYIISISLIFLIATILLAIKYWSDKKEALSSIRQAENSSRKFSNTQPHLSKPHRIQKGIWINNHDIITVLPSNDAKEKVSIRIERDALDEERLKKLFDNDNSCVKGVEQILSKQYLEIVVHSGVVLQFDKRFIPLSERYISVGRPLIAKVYDVIGDTHYQEDIDNKYSESTPPILRSDADTTLESVNGNKGYYGIEFFGAEGSKKFKIHYTCYKPVRLNN